MVLPSRLDLVGADVLRDAAGLARGHLGVADRVEQRRLAVVDVAHDRHDRRARRRGRPSSSSGTSTTSSTSSAARDDLDLLVELVGEDLDRVVGQRLRERRHLAEAHELLDDLGDGDAEVLGDVLDRRAGVDLDEVGVGQRVLVERGRLLLLEVAPAPAAATAAAALALLRRTAAGAAGATRAAGAAPRGLRVDDDAPAAAEAGPGRARPCGCRASAGRPGRRAPPAGAAGLCPPGPPGR